MSDAAPAETYRVEEHLRPLTAEEDARVRAERADFRARREAHFDRKQRSSPVATVGLAAAAIVVCLALGARIPLALVAGAFGALVGALVSRGDAFGDRLRDGLYESGRSVWDAPKGRAWQVREVVVQARSVVAATGMEGDDTTYLLYEIPGDAWFFVDTRNLPDGSSFGDLARRRVKFTWLDPPGPLLGVEPSGDGIVLFDDDPASEGDDFVWSPREEHWERFVVPEAEVPAWIRNRASSASRTPPRRT
jgi:hypothetical protein